MKVYFMVIYDIQDYNCVNCQVVNPARYPKHYLLEETCPGGQEISDQWYGLDEVVGNVCTLK
jgi:hypothetical protein